MIILNHKNSSYFLVINSNSFIRRYNLAYLVEYY